MGIFWQELFIQAYVYQPGLDRELFCYENLMIGWNVDCSESDIDCTNMFCYRFDLDFGKAITNAVGLLSLYISLVSFMTVILVVMISARKNGNRIQKWCANVTGFVISGIIILLYLSLVVMDFIVLIKSGNFYKYLSDLNYIGAIILILYLAAAVEWSKFEETITPPQDQLTLEVPKVPNDLKRSTRRHTHNGVHYDSI